MPGTHVAVEPPAQAGEARRSGSAQTADWAQFRKSTGEAVMCGYASTQAGGSGERAQ